jgi:hypothetical protein
MIWETAINFTTVISASHVNVLSTAVYQGKLYVAVSPPLGNGTHNPQIWTFDGSVWEFNKEFVIGSGSTNIYPLYVFDGKLFTASRRYPMEILVYNGSTWETDFTFTEPNPHPGAMNLPTGAGSFLSYGGELYIATGGDSADNNIGTVWKREGAGVWTLISFINPSPWRDSAYGMGVYGSEFFVGTMEQPSAFAAKTYKIRRFDGLDFSIVESVPDMATSGADAPWAFTEYNGLLYVGGGKRVWTYDGATWTTQHTHLFSTTRTQVDSIVYNEKLFTSLGTRVLVYDGSSWEVSLNDISATSFRGFSVFNDKLYVGGENGKLYSGEEEPPLPGYNVKILGISRAKASGGRVWVTGWRPNRLFLRAYNSTNLTLEQEINLGPATLAQVNSKELIAYPYAPNTGGNNDCFVYGRMSNVQGNGPCHVARTQNGGVGFQIIEDGWENTHCGALATNGYGQIIAVRNYPTQSKIYIQGEIGRLVYRSTLPVGPINHKAFKLRQSDNRVYIGGPGVYESLPPYTYWFDLTYDHDMSSTITAIDIL